MSERDTQFAGFANLLYMEMCAYGVAHPDTEDATPYLEIIARRAYDLACHVATHTVLTAYGDMIKIPDMTTLPEVKSE